jgi:hypothetical protein
MSRPSPEAETWSFPAGVHAVAVADDLVFLDVTADAYFCIPFGALSADVWPEARGLKSGDGALIECLRETGLVAPGAAPPAAPADPFLSMPCVTAPPPPLPRFGWRDVREAASCTLDLLLNYRGKSLAALLEAAQRPFGAVVPSQAPQEVLTIAARFRRWVPFAPVSSKCLLRSFMLLRLLRRMGHDAHWVFGVGTWPFSAHCWLQVGDVVLDDFHERLLPYRIILVV